MRYLKGFLIAILTLSATAGICFWIHIVVHEDLPAILYVGMIVGIIILTYIFATEIFDDE